MTGTLVLTKRRTDLMPRQLGSAHGLLGPPTMSAFTPLLGTSGHQPRLPTFLIYEYTT
jgi:hypothetical protein